MSQEKDFQSQVDAAVEKKRLLSVDFAKEVSAVVKELPENLPVGSLILWKSRVRKDAANLRKHFIKYPPYYVTASDAQKDLEIIDGLPETPKIWADFMENLGRTKWEQLTQAIRRTTDNGARARATHLLLTVEDLGQLYKDLKKKNAITKAEAFVALAFKR